MKIYQYLALVGALGSAEALHIQAGDAQCKKDLQKCELTNKNALYTRHLVIHARKGSFWDKAYIAWWHKDRNSKNLAQVEDESQCAMELTQCKQDQEKLVNWIGFMNDKTTRAGKSLATGLRRYGYKLRAADWVKRHQAKIDQMLKENPLEHNDGTLSESDSDDSDGFPEIKQEKVKKTCTGSFERLMRESKGKVTPKPGVLWEDQSFPADGTSIDWNRSDNRGWFRPTQVEKSPSLYGNIGANVGAANQGGLGNCWFIASMSAVGEFPNVVKKIFRGAEEYPTNGQVNLEMYMYGKPIKVMIDDRLPKGFSRKGKNGAWWAPLLEKGAAKYWGYYKRMHGGWMGDAMNVLVHQPQDTITNKRHTIDELWNMLKQYDGKNAIMSSASDEKSPNLYGLVKYHAYTTIGTAEYTDPKTKQTHRLVKMRNPWGGERYNGPWSDKSREMTANNGHAMKALKHTNANDGIFFTDIKTYHSIVRANTIINYQENYKRSQRMAAWDRTKSFKGLKWTFYNPVAQKVNIATSAPRPRVFSKNDCNTHLQSDWVRFKMQNGSKNTQDAVKFGGTQQTNNWFIYETLPAGNYEVSIQGHWKLRPGVMDFGLVGLSTKQEIKWL